MAPLQPSTLLSRALDLLPRQDIVAIPNTYSDINNSPPPGTVVGIVIGSVAGFLLVLWLIATCFGFRVPMTYGSDVESISVVSRHRHSRSSHSRSYSPSRRRSGGFAEAAAYASRAPQQRRETIVVDQIRRSSRDGRAYAMERDDDIVDIVDDGPPRRKGSKRSNRH